ncbi:2'-5' RNA ligase family protein [Streptomyces sp. TRM 70361]|uniref:2'-5' RNA ligase family protein n=1 Tax=Streptomyces sp. TRM 70361 TaxID=3116553 RepID=UPI002E7C0A82|nr:2'-5' RNA ligase family protein [Streptomyces sp. TRM 70361]MEE1938173.1 2'-5' RNA ligase family protein [Streptomyces sp. TRM 70361]
MTTAEAMADHWWWRPGWMPGRRFYTWHLTFRNAPEVHRLADAHRRGLAGVPGLDLVPDSWLHLTMQGLGFVDEVPERDARAIADAAARHLAAVEPFELRLHKPRITPEAIRWEAEPDGPPVAAQAAIRAAIAEVWGEVPEPEGGFAPHVTIAYSNGTGPTAPVARALDAVEAGPATARIEQADLIVLGRDNRMYEWETFATARLG